MTKPSPEALAPLWDRALESEIGIAVETNEPKRLRQELLNGRRVLNRPELRLHYNLPPRRPE